ncbi:Hypothetical predicted protein [Paramuricea clavata]|uniref:Uncharacterized protein n=1 Tax=Paramuricea clavata TaxID=317549 RepID=A0A6S7IFL2_PARCT|nr:Hypothetical predicted protein [Paramuricea clavata]
MGPPGQAKMNHGVKSMSEDACEEGEISVSTVTQMVVDKTKTQTVTVTQIVTQTTTVTATIVHDPNQQWSYLAGNNWHPHQATYKAKLQVCRLLIPKCGCGEWNRWDNMGLFAKAWVDSGKETERLDQPVVYNEDGF